MFLGRGIAYSCLTIGKFRETEVWNQTAEVKHDNQITAKSGPRCPEKKLGKLLNSDDNDDNF